MSNSDTSPSFHALRLIRRQLESLWDEYEEAIEELDFLVSINRRRPGDSSSAELILPDEPILDEGRVHRDLAELHVRLAGLQVDMRKLISFAIDVRLEHLEHTLGTRSSSEVSDSPKRDCELFGWRAGE